MNIILLSGGSGKRLWPLSDDIRSKQYIKIFKNSDGKYESMLQHIYRKLKSTNTNSLITIAASKSQISTIKNQIADNVDISEEPCNKDTFPAIVLATAYLHDVKKIPLDETVIVCPVDHYVKEDYFAELSQLCKLAQESSVNLSLIGINPTYPSEKYGYIIPESLDKVSKVKMFKEKPDSDTARSYIENGALWNSGIFAFKLRYVLDIAHKLIDFKDYYDLYEKYETLEKISFDYAVVEKETDTQVMRFCGQWKDLGTWNTFTESMDKNIIGKVITDETCNNTHIINELNIPILCMGAKDMVVVATSQGILVTDKQQSSYMKPFVEKLNIFDDGYEK